jgi:broad specificity phosphatase PhoE
MSFLRRLFGSEPPPDNLRIIITRHGERADLALGPKWVSKIEKTGRQDPRVSYLTPRYDFHEWNYDPPLTVDGERQSQSIGRKLLNLGYPIDYCYSSPAYRSIQTANKLLDSQGRKSVTINIEPGMIKLQKRYFIFISFLKGLFECPVWYSGAPLPFIPAESIAMDRRFNINPSYTPVYGSVDATEDERRYYERSRRLIDSIVKAHKDQGGTVLLSGHAGSIETITRGVLGRRAQPENLRVKAEKVDYCNCAILERDGRTQQWSVHFPSSSENPYGGQRSLQSSIPLYSATSRYLTSHSSHGLSSSASTHSYGDRSRHHSYRSRRSYGWY